MSNGLSDNEEIRKIFKESGFLSACRAAGGDGSGRNLIIYGIKSDDDVAVYINLFFMGNLGRGLRIFS